MSQMIKNFLSKHLALMRKDYGELNTEFVLGSVDIGDSIRKRLGRGDLAKRSLLE